ncbi:serine hydrolase domain-containing protein [Streptomyces sp. NPDC002328]|uniref:serine hydrolase domain-containing protein n=1 Tax=Streptomyces sp. NPDC002328 TaxID=3364642 RepID=UPI0036B9EBAC
MLLVVTVGATGPAHTFAAATGPAGPTGPTGPAAALRIERSVPQALDPATVARLDAAIRDTMTRAGIPGVNVGLWMPGGDAYVKSFGVADRESRAPMEAGLHLRIGSVTKTFTVTALLQLVDQGRVGLDDPIGRYVDGVPAGDRVTLRQLAAMRSGLFDYTEDETFLKDLSSDPQRTYTPRQLLDIAFRHPSPFSPGAEWQYSNTNTVLIGLVIERVSGQPLHTYLEEKVYEPVGLARTSFPTGSAIPDPHAQGYTAEGVEEGAATVDATGWNPSWAWAAGAMISDLGDLHTWVPALASGRPLLAPETQRARLAFGPTGYPGVSYGLGIMRVNGWIGHNGELPGYETLAVRLPSAEATLVVLVNSDVDYQGEGLSTLIGRAVTQIVTPDNVFSLPAAAQAGTATPSPDTSGSPGSPGTPNSPGSPGPTSDQRARTTR